jgi:phosphoglycerate kinase
MSLAKRTLDSVDFAGKRVFIRVDFNVPIKDGVIGDDTRIRAAVPTILAVLGAGGSVIAASHLGRPNGKVVEELRMGPIAQRLQLLLGSSIDVKWVHDVRGDLAKAAAADLEPGQVLVLENLRFEAGETANDPAMAADLAAMADVFVQDAFGTCHRAHASTAGLPGLLKPAIAGKLLQNEIDAFDMAFGKPKRPVIAVIGGAKVSDKIMVLENLLDKVDTVLIGGGMAYTFLAATGIGVGASLCEVEKFEVARAVLAKAAAKGVKLLLPMDHVIADRFAADANTQRVTGAIPAGWMGLDIGQKTTELYSAEISAAATVVWNGPMGVFELEPFSHGTSAIAKVLAATDNLSIVGGGDSVAAIKKNQVESRISHISTGGGAFLEMLEGKVLPGIAALDNK